MPETLEERVSELELSRATFELMSAKLRAVEIATDILMWRHGGETLDPDQVFQLASRIIDFCFQEIPFPEDKPEFSNPSSDSPGLNTWREPRTSRFATVFPGDLVVINDTLMKAVKITDAYVYFEPRDKE